MAEAELREDLRELRANVRDDFEQIRDNMGDIRDRLTKHETEDSARHTTVVDKIDDLRTVVSSLTREMTSITNQMSGITVQVNGVTSQVEGISTQVKGLSESVAASIANTAALSQAIQTQHGGKSPPPSGLSRWVDPNIVNAGSSMLGGALIIVLYAFLSWIGVPLPNGPGAPATTASNNPAAEP